MGFNKNKKMKRREFIAYGSTIGLCGIGAAISGVSIYKYLMPVVSYGTPRKFKMSTGDIPDPGEEIIFSDQKVILIRGVDKKVAAISLVCTHLGCTVNRVTTGFQCPCHGSQYDEDGIVVGGPAPKPLAWLSIKMLPGEEIEIDTGSRLKENSYFNVLSGEKNV